MRRETIKGCAGVYPIIVVVIMIIMIIIMLMIIIMIIHLFAGAFQDTRGRLAKHSGKGTLSMSMG